MALDPFNLQRTVNPEAVQPRFLNDDDRDHFPVRRESLLLSSVKRVSSAAMSPAGTLCFDIFSPPPGNTDVTSQIERLSSKETKIAPRSGLDSGRFFGVVQLLTAWPSPEWVVATSLCQECRSLSASPWDLEPRDRRHERCDDDGEGRARPALPQSDDVLARLSARDAEMVFDAHNLAREMAAEMRVSDWRRYVSAAEIGRNAQLPNRLSQRCRNLVPFRE